MHVFLAKLEKFPCKYLGMPLTTKHMSKLDVQPLIDKMVGKLLGWKGKLLNKAGRLTLTDSVLTSQPVYHLLVFQLNK